MMYPPPFMLKPPTPRTAMAQKFNGTSQYSASAYLLTLLPYSQITVCFWLYWTTYNTSDNLALEYDANYNNGHAFIFDPNSSGPDSGKFDIGVSSTNNSTETVVGITRPSANAWHHIAAPFNLKVAGASQIPYVLVDGISQALTVGLSTGVPSTFQNDTLYVMSRAGTSLFGSGAMSDLCIFRGILSQSDIQKLSMGADPRTLTADNLLYYWTLSFLHPEPNWGWNSGPMTPHTTAAQPAPPILAAQSRQSNLLTQLKGASPPPPGSGGRSLMLMGVGQ